MGASKRKRAQPANTTTWSKCGLSLNNWKKLLSTIAYDITEPENIVGLEGLASHGQVWQNWFDAYLNGPLKRKFWGASSEHVFKFARDAKIISKLIRPFVVEAAREARRPIAPLPIGEVPTETQEGRKHNRFHALEDVEGEDQTSEMDPKAGQAMAISMVDDEVKQHISPDIVLSHEYVRGEDDQRQMSFSPCIRTILRPNLKSKTRSADNVGVRKTAAQQNQSINRDISQNTRDDSIAKGVQEISEDNSRSHDGDADKANSLTPAEVWLRSTDTALLLSGSPVTDQAEPSPMADVEYTIANCTYSRAKQGDWEKASAIHFNWNALSSLTGDDQPRSGQGEHGKKRCKIDRSFDFAVPEVSNTSTCHAEGSIALEPRGCSRAVNDPSELIGIPEDLPTSPRLQEQAVIGEDITHNTPTHITEASITSTGLLSPPLDSNGNQSPAKSVPGSHIQGLENNSHTLQIPSVASADPIPTNLADLASAIDETPSPRNDPEKTQTTKQQALVITQNSQPNEPEDIIAAAATLRIANCLVPYTQQGLFPPLVFASTGMGKQLGAKFDYRFHYWAHPPSIATFLKELYNKHEIPLHRHINSLKVIIEGNTLHIEVIRYQGGWDWRIAMDLAARRNCRVEVIFETE